MLSVALSGAGISVSARSWIADNTGMVLSARWEVQFVCQALECSGMGVKRGVVWAIEDVFTLANFDIAATAGLIGYVVFEFLQKRF